MGPLDLHSSRGMGTNTAQLMTMVTQLAPCIKTRKWQGWMTPHTVTAQREEMSLQICSQRSPGVPTVFFVPLWILPVLPLPWAAVVRPRLVAGWLCLQVLPVPDSLSLPAATLLTNSFPGSWSLHELAARRLPRQQTSVTDFCSPRGQEGSGHVLQWDVGISSSRWQKSVAPKFSPLLKWWAWLSTRWAGTAVSLQERTSTRFPVPVLPGSRVSLGS